MFLKTTNSTYRNNRSSIISSAESPFTLSTFLEFHRTSSVGFTDFVCSSSFSMLYSFLLILVNVKRTVYCFPLWFSYF